MVGFRDTIDNSKGYDQRFAGKDPGPYIGVVKFVDDPLRQGRLGVNIPDLSNTSNPGIDDVIWCQYLSPFYGAKSLEATSKSDPNDYKSTQHSYGFWAVPPDIDTEVLVIFVKGEVDRRNAFWIGCVQQPLVNQQVPGYGASTLTEQASDRSSGRERRIAELGTGKTQNYGTDFLPVGEKNRRMIEGAQTESFANSIRYPVNDILAEQLVQQGLILDDVRGTTSSSARRETPSQVFGLNTPGRVRSDSRTRNIGIGNVPVRPDREPGHSFVMDDGDVNGNNQQTRIRTASGHQILMNDTEGTVYIANGSGKAFIEMEKDGTISVFSDQGINLRTGGDFNLHSDTNINFHAKQGINFTAEQNVALNAEQYVLVMGESGILSASQKGSVRQFGRDSITSYTNGQQLHGASGRIDLAGSQVHFNSVGARSSWGPGWLQPSHQSVGIKTTNASDVDSMTPIKNGKVNTSTNKTTVSDFVTHEPYTRTSSTALQKKYINDTMTLIAKENPKLSSQELQDIRYALHKEKSVDAISSKVQKLVNLNDNVKLSLATLNNIKSQATSIKATIQSQAMGFVQGQISAGISAVKKFFRF
jgi:hypothetical protein